MTTTKTPSKKSPLTRIREKNREIKELKQTIQDIASLLSCQPTYVDIAAAVSECKLLGSSLVATQMENDKLRLEMGEQIASEVEKLTFSLQVKNKKLEDEVEFLQKKLDTKDKELETLRLRPRNGDKGFWDFLYRYFKLLWR